MTHAVAGLIPILATPFHSDGSLDTESLARLVDFSLWCGVDGVATFGMASEGFALTADERARMLEVFTARVPSGMPIVAGIGATSTVTAVEQAQLSRDAGATALMVLPPFMVKASPAQLVDFYGTVASTSGLPVMVQDAPAVTGVSMPVPTLVELSKLDGVTSAKIEAQPTAPKVAALVDAVDDFAVLGGQNALFALEEYGRGAVGTMPACEFADVFAAVLSAWAEGRDADARERFARLLPLIRFGMQGPIAWAVHKHVLVHRGVISDPAVRAPAAPLDAASERDLRLILDDLRLPSFP
ncbi:dihydrodipicolinate synthase family protein [Actinoallomurus iriomotensis]|uniref:Dihydrodipicolinate synthase family protein n=1 Tax=Actinoallomurus iriomotensis TaxID=478107 RepID=A0A9W6RG28_9ACTN|nr:dihydrodipicolinate synthase family protein [Actinoallomurus iriomotensis]GLY73965.1 dihydrodipicolinate synthase family protein [Actinoallomurus iriomotensis]